MNEDYVRREEDRKWREKVEHELVTLLTGHQVEDRRLDELENQVEELDRTVRGDFSTEHAGLVERQHEQETKLSRIWAVLFAGDPTGEKGMVDQWREERRGRERREHRWEVNRTSLTAIVVAAISTLGLLLSEWPKVREAFHRETPAIHLQRLEKEINELRHENSPEARKQLKKLRMEAYQMQSQPDVWQ